MEWASNPLKKQLAAPITVTALLLCKYLAKQVDTVAREVQCSRFSPPVAGIAPSGIVKVNQQEGSFQLSSGLVSLYLVTKEYGVSSNRVSSSS